MVRVRNTHASYHSAQKSESEEVTEVFSEKIIDRRGKEKESKESRSILASVC